MKSRPMLLGAAFGGVAAVALFTVAVDAYSLSSYKWKVSPVRVYLNPSNADVSASAAEAAVQSALTTWSTQPGSAFKYEYGGRVNTTAAVYDSRNVVFFRNSSNGGAIASTYSWWSGGSRVDSDVIFWDGSWRFFTGTTGCKDGAYVEDVVTHELGHALGLGHSSVTDATMYSSYSRCSVAMRSPSSDDIAGLKLLYPGSTTSTNTAPVVAITSPLSGASVSQGTAVTFAGSASDTQDGSLTSALVWTSSLDGQIGTGGGFSRALSVGSHTITAKVVDKGGLSASKQVGVTVTSTTTVAPAPAPSSTNVALASAGAVARASSIYAPLYGPGTLINGDRKGLNWGANGGWKDATQYVYPDWVEIEFKGPQTVNRVDVFSLQDGYKTPVEPTSTLKFTKYGVTAFHIEYWTGSAWAKVPGATVTGNDLVWKSVQFSSITTSKIRVVIDVALDTWSRAVEVEVRTP